MRHSRRFAAILSSICLMGLGVGVWGCSDDSGQKSPSQDANDPTKPDNPNDSTGDSGNTGNTGNTGNSGNTGNTGDPTTKPDSCEGVDLKTSNAHCGACNNACNEYSQCVDGECTCAEGNNDCDGDGICDTYGECICTPGDTMQCYFGAPEEIDRGECRAGVFECKKGIDGYYRWGSECVGMVMPSYDYICDIDRPDLDLDCNGIPDAEQDEDGDGYAICKKIVDENGEEQLVADDCCDNKHMCNTNRPEFVHPGQTECKGNGLDDNCDGAVDPDDAPQCGTETTVVEADCKIKDRSCSDLSSWTYGNQDNVSATGALELAKALDACLDVVTAESGLPGLIEYSVSPASVYNIGLDARQINIKDGMYDVEGTKRIAPRSGNTFVILSSGIAGDVKTELAAHGTDDKRLSLGGTIPEPYRTAHENRLQTHPNCPSGGADIYDSVRLHLKIRAPETAKGFSFDFRFFSREYPYYVCSSYNDFFLSLLTDESGKPLAGVNPDGNISFDKVGNPVSVNNAFFTTCTNAPCSGNYKMPVKNSGCPAMLTCNAENPEAAQDEQIMSCGGNMCKDGNEELAAYYTNFYSSRDDDPEMKVGGGTAWLTTQAPVEPGQIFNLDFYIWDTGDLRYDSSVIIDNFQWKCTETTVGTDFADASGTVN